MDLSTCMIVVGKVHDIDSTSLLERIDVLTSAGVPVERAQTMAAADVLADLQRERKNLVALVAEKYPAEKVPEPAREPAPPKPVRSVYFTMPRDYVPRQSRESLAEDAAAQELWLNERARELGFTDIDQLVDRDFDAFMGLADRWRQDHPAEILQARTKEPGPLYLSRPVVNADEIAAWARSVGIQNVTPPSKMHATIAYSTASVDSRDLGPVPDALTVDDSGRALKRLGEDDAIVMTIESGQLRARWKQAIDAGASWDFMPTKPAYTPHITLSYTGQDIDLSKITPFAGRIDLGPEVAADLQSGWSASLAQSRPPGGYVLPEFGFGSVVIEKIQDRYNRWKQVVDAVREQGGVVTEASDFYRAEERYWGSVAARAEDFDKEVTEFTAALDKDKIDLRSMQLYAYAKHAKERNAYLRSKREAGTGGFDSWSGMDDDTADAILDDAAQAGLTPVFERHHATLMKWTQGTRDTMLQEGLITDDQYLMLNAAYDNYVPLKGRAGTTEKRGTGGGFNIRGKETERARGRYSEADNILEHIIQDRVRTLTRAGKNQVLRSFLQFVIDNPDQALWDINAVESKPVMTVDDQGNQVIVEQQAVIKDDRTVGIKDGGREVFVLIKDEKLREQMQNMHVEDIGQVVGHMLAAQRMMGRLYTSLSPTFMVLNAARDVQAATVGMIDEAGFTGAARMWKNMPRAILMSFQAELGSSSPEYQLYRATGGKTGFFDFKDIDTISKDLQKRIARAELSGADPRVWGPRALDLIEKLNGGVENSTRLAAFLASRESGMSVAEAARVSKNITVNFNRKGTLTPALGAFFLFFNPAVQGTARIAQALKSPKVLATLGAGMTGVAMLALQNASMGDDDDGVAWWDKIPQEVKDRNLVILLPPGATNGDPVPGSKQGRYVKIPMPYGYNFFATVANQAVDLWRNRVDPARGVGAAQATKRAVTSFLGAYMPVQELARSIETPKTAVLAAVPDFLNAPAQAALNISPFGRSMYPEGQWNERTADASKYFPAQAGTIFQRTAAALNEATGGNPYKAGLLDFTPATIELFVRAYGGGPASFALDTVNMVYARQAIERPDVDVRRGPFIKQLYGRIDAETDRMLGYERMDKVADVVDPIAAARRDHKYELAAEMQKAAGPIYRVGETVKNVREQLSVIRKQELAIIAGDEPDAVKYARLTALGERTRKQLQRVNRAYNDAMRAGQ